MPKEKVYVPVAEPKSTSCVEYIELGRTVTPQPVFKKDTIRIRLLQRCLGNPTETFDTEKHWEYDVPWSEERQEEVVMRPIKSKTEEVQVVNQAPEPAWKKIKRVIL